MICNNFYSDDTFQSMPILVNMVAEIDIGFLYLYGIFNANWRYYVDGRHYYILLPGEE